MIDEVNTHRMNECRQYKENCTESVKCGFNSLVSQLVHWVQWGTNSWYSRVVGGRGGAHGGAGPLNISDQG